MLKAFARHETFHPRYGWLKKGYDAATADPEVFIRPNAPVILGVGKNMVRAIRYWCKAFKVLEDYSHRDRPRVLLARPTKLGSALFSDDGLDPYLENPASLWLLHWELLRPPSIAPAWNVVFNDAPSHPLTEADLLALLVDARNREAAWADVADASLKKDCDCLLRMYTSASDGMLRRPGEDAVDSPFAELGLLHALGGDAGHYALVHGAHASLPAGIVVFACLDFMTFPEQSGAHMVSLWRLTRTYGSPGRVLRVNEEVIRESLVACRGLVPEVRVVESVGGAQMVCSRDPADVAWRLLRDSYEMQACCAW